MIQWEFKVDQAYVPATILNKLAYQFGCGWNQENHVATANFQIPKWNDLNMQEYLDVYYDKDEVDFIRRRFQFFKEQVNR